MSYQYTYLILDLCFLIVWLFLFFWRKDTRKEMLVMSSLFGAVGVATAFVYIKDWWHPLTITGTAVGVEDFLFGAVIGGISSVIYEEVFKKKIKPRKRDTKKRIRGAHFFVLFGICAIIFFGGFYLLRLNTFVATILTCIFGLALIYVKRRDLILDSLISGCLIVSLSSIVYFVVNKITPGWVSSFWYFRNVSPAVIFNVPLDDIVWYFFFGALIGPLYEYWQEGRLAKIK